MNWQAVGIALALLGLLVTIVTGAVKFGHRDARLDELERSKLDRSQYYQDLGAIKADLRVIRCRTVPDDCPMGSP